MDFRVRVGPGGAEFFDRAEVELGAPTGAATVTTLRGLTLTVTRTASAFSLSIDQTLGLPTCRSIVSVRATASSFISEAETFTLPDGSTQTVTVEAAVGPVTGTLVTDCPPTLTTQAQLAGEFVAAPFLAEVSRPQAIVTALRGAASGLLGFFRWTGPAPPGTIVGGSPLVVAQVKPGFQFIADFVGVPLARGMPLSSYFEAIQTGGDAEVTLQLPEGSTLTIGPNSTVSYSAFNFGRGRPVPPGFPELIVTIQQLAGTVGYSIATGGRNEFIIQTPVGSISVTGTRFTASYSQPDLTGNLAVAVQEGRLEVANRQDQRTTVSAGSATALQDVVSRVTMLTPADGMSLPAGRTTTLTWTSFPGATGYLIEYAPTPPGFARANPAAPERTENTVRLSGGFTVLGGLVSLPVPVPLGLAAGTRVSVRVFPLDSAGRILTGSTGSDAVTFSIAPVP